MNAAGTPSRRAAGITALVAGAVCLFIITTMIMAVQQDRRLTPLNSPEIARLKTDLAERPNDDALKELIRRRDHALRTGFFSRQEAIRSGGWLLVAAGAALVIALKSYGTLSKHPTLPDGGRVDMIRENLLARWGVAVSGLVVVGVCGAWMITARPQLPVEQALESAAAPAADADALSKNWVSFRGLRGDGVVQGSIPETWDGKTGQNILWKTPIPLPGHGSPVVFEGLAFVAGSDGKVQEVFAFDSTTGHLKWRSAVPRSSSQEIKTIDDTGYAANSPVTDGARVYALFASGDLAAFDYSGKRLWNKSMGSTDSTYGYASSLALHSGNVIVQWDQGSESDRKSALICFDGATGKQVWRTARPVGAAWSSPVVVDGVIYTTGLPFVMAHDAATGKELWRAELMHGDVAPSPVVVNGIVYVANDQSVAAALNAKAGQVIWKTEEGRLPDMVSPLCDGKYLLLTHGGGALTCLDAATGAQVWEQDQDASVQASPILANGVVYWTGLDGVTSVFALKDSYERIRSMPLGEKVSASVAAVNGKLYIRGKDNLYCIGAK